MQPPDPRLAAVDGSTRNRYIPSLEFCFSLHNAKAAPVIGKTLAHYKITEQIGAGGMGVVYRASDSKLGRDVALKILPDTFAKDPERMVRFQREAQVLAQLNHANIAAIYGIETKGDSTALVLELVEGPTLDERIRSGRVPQNEALFIARQMAEAIESAHEAGIIHRDLKPANVKLTLEGNVKVLDFGLAKALDGDPSQSASGATADSPTISPMFTSPLITGALTGANVILGTAAYMSPEQARAKPVDKRCDIWSFGVVLFEMLTGKNLFAGDTLTDTLAAVVKTDPEWDDLPADLSPAIRRLLRQCLERDPRKRLRDIGDARIAIEEVLEGREETVAETPSSVPTGPRHKAERFVWLGALLVAIALGLWGRLASTDSSGAVADWNLSIARTGEPGEGSFVALSPDGSTVAFTNRSGIQLRRLDQLDPVLVEDTEKASAPFWSPDGRSLGFTQDRKLKRVTLDTGFVEAIADMPNPRAPGTWIEGDRILFAPSYSDELMIVPASGDSPPLPATKKESDLGLTAGHRWATPLPDGNRFLFVEQDYDGNTSSIRVGSLDSIGSRVLLPRRQTTIGLLSLQDAHLLYVRDWILLAHPFAPGNAEFTGNPLVMLGGARVSFFSVSETGVLAWVPARDESEVQARLTWLDRSGKVLETLVDLPNNVGSPRISRDGKYFVFSARSADLDDDHSLFVYDLDRASSRRIISSGGILGNWSPDGERIAYLGAGSHLWIADVTGTNPPEPGTGGESDDDAHTIPTDWSPDGRHIVFLRSHESKISVWILPVDGGDPFAYAENVGQSGPSFAPNGRWIAYTSKESGRTEVYVDSFPTRGNRVQVSTRGGSQPRWRRDGRELFFAVSSDQSELVEFHAVDVDEVDGLLAFGAPVALFKTRPMTWNQYYDVSADGQRFLMPIKPDLPPRPIHVQADWKRGLEE